MSGFKIDLRGYDGINKKLLNMATETKAILRDELNEFGQNTVNDAKNNLTASKTVDMGGLRNSITYELKEDNNGINVDVIVASNYAAFTEWGTRGHAAAEVASLPAEWQEFAAQYKGKTGGTYAEFLMRIFEWVKRKGIGAELTKSGATSKSKSSLAAQEQAAYLIAKSIMRKGVRPSPFLRPAVEKNRLILIDNLKNALQ